VVQETPERGFAELRVVAGVQDQFVPHVVDGMASFAFGCQRALPSDRATAANRSDRSNNDEFRIAGITGEIVGILYLLPVAERQRMVGSVPVIPDPDHVAFGRERRFR
jgi:hypothetical protein